MASKNEHFDLARKYLISHGEVRAQPASDWNGTIALPASVAEYYHMVGPVDIYVEQYGNPFYLPSLKGLWKLQAGYRWNGLDEEATETWPRNWLVAASTGDGAIIFDIDSEHILFGLHGPSLYEADDLFDDIGMMAATLGALGGIVESAGVDFMDNNCVIRPIFCEQAISRVALIVGSASRSCSVLKTLGW